MTEDRKETIDEVNHNQGIDEEPVLSRVSRKASRQQKQKQKQERPASSVKKTLGSIGSAVKRYGSFASAILKSPVKTVVADGFSHFKYAVISMVLFSVIFSIGNWFQLKASKGRQLGYGVHHPFYDGFFVVLVYALIFLAVMVFSIWIVSRYMMKQKLPFKKIAADFGSLLVPVMALSVLWMIFAIVNITPLTTAFTILMFFGLLFSVSLLIQSIHQKADNVSLDLIYCVLAALAVGLIFIAASWPFISGYLTSSLIPL
ncbi:hypothetical protein MOE86_12150 [Bacillus atrophaeus]|uniref:hypothetical protein n=1 Tax=Bacillus atrophaeus TaxID=1452 RepID=UPI00228091D6|nr:hypothetical protein [Bacillus atrophaeus]MCY9197450.1 hypothetical protein [Bacillus atrophaeus]